MRKCNQPRRALLSKAKYLQASADATSLGEARNAAPFSQTPNNPLHFYNETKLLGGASRHTIPTIRKARHPPKRNHFPTVQKAENLLTKTLDGSSVA